MDAIAECLTAQVRLFYVIFRWKARHEVRANVAYGLISLSLPVLAGRGRFPRGLRFGTNWSEPFSKMIAETEDSEYPGLFPVRKLTTGGCAPLTIFVGMMVP